jgi:uncharacterized protein (DUF302 family)
MVSKASHAQRPRGRKSTERPQQEHARSTSSQSIQPLYQHREVAPFSRQKNLSGFEHFVEFNCELRASAVHVRRDRRAHNEEPPAICCKEAAVTSSSDNKIDGFARKPSNYSVDQTVQRLQEMLRSNGVTLFALVDHSGGAQKAGLQMRPTKLLIFGNPKGDTPLMIASPSIAIDLPLKILVYEDEGAKVWVAYNSSRYLQTRHHLPEELLKNIAIVETLAAEAAQ